MRAYTTQVWSKIRDGLLLLYQHYPLTFEGALILWWFPELGVPPVTNTNQLWGSSMEHHFSQVAPVLCRALLSTTMHFV